MGNPWRITQINELIKLNPHRWGGRLSIMQIAKSPVFSDHTPRSIQSVIAKYDLADPLKRELRLKHPKLTDEQKQEVIEFLSTNAKYWPAEVAAKRFSRRRFSVSVRTIRRYRKEHNLVFPHEICLQDKTYHRWWAAQRKRLAKSHEKNVRKLRLPIIEEMFKKKRELDALKQDLESKGALKATRNFPKNRLCSVCKETFYNTDDFFPSVPYIKKDGSRGTYRKGVCKACSTCR